jgi:hypothetical protein
MGGHAIDHHPSTYQVWNLARTKLDDELDDDELGDDPFFLGGSDEPWSIVHHFDHHMHEHECVQCVLSLYGVRFCLLSVPTLYHAYRHTHKTHIRFPKTAVLLTLSQSIAPDTFLRWTVEPMHDRLVLVLLVLVLLFLLLLLAPLFSGSYKCHTE